MTTMTNFERQYEGALKTLKNFISRTKCLTSASRSHISNAEYAAFNTVFMNSNPKWADYIEYVSALSKLSIRIETYRTVNIELFKVLENFVELAEVRFNSRNAVPEITTPKVAAVAPKVDDTTTLKGSFPGEFIINFVTELFKPPFYGDVKKYVGTNGIDVKPLIDNLDIVKTPSLAVFKENVKKKLLDGGVVMKNGNYHQFLVEYKTAAAEKLKELSSPKVVPVVVEDSKNLEITKKIAQIETLLADLKSQLKK